MLASIKLWFGSDNFIQYTLSLTWSNVWWVLNKFWCVFSIRKPCFILFCVCAHVTTKGNTPQFTHRLSSYTPFFPGITPRVFFLRFRGVIIDFSSIIGHNWRLIIDVKKMNESQHYHLLISIIEFNILWSSVFFIGILIMISHTVKW